MKLITLSDIQTNERVNEFLKMGNKNLELLGYTEHGIRHASLVGHLAGNILRELKYPERDAQLAEISGYLHDIGNFMSRNDHCQTGAIISWKILEDMNMNLKEIGIITGAVGNHDEEFGQAVSNIAAATILADKSDVHRDRVRNGDFATFDIHDRVNYASQSSDLTVKIDDGVISLNIVIDMNITPVMEYFEIFLTRMIMCRRAATFLDCKFELIINNSKLL